MQWIQSAFSSSSSSKPNSPPKRNFRDINYFFRKSSKVSRRLTRQRKLRHLSDIDVGRLPLSTFVRSDYYISNTCDSPSDLDLAVSSRLSPVEPQPLPLPELSVFFKDSPVIGDSPAGGGGGGAISQHSGRFPLPSPKEFPTRLQPEDKTDYACGGGGDEITTSSGGGGGGDDFGGGASPNNGFVRNGAYQSNYKNTEQVDAQSIKSPIDRGKKVRQERNSYGNVQNNIRQNASAAMSAPGSGLSSPTLSPRRMSSGDSFPFHNGATQGFIWSAPEMAAMDPFCQASSKDTWSYVERSPCHGSGLIPKNSSGAGSQLYPRFSPDRSSSRHENNSQAQVHTLPLPPVLAVSSPTPLAHQSLIRPEVTPMVSQWQKGKLIGRGTFGSVYVATNRETGALCAMKEVDLIPDDPKSAECMKQLEQEIKVLSQLKHPNIVQYYGSEIVGDHFYIYLEYVYPGSINKYVREHYGAITESVVRNFTRHILSGLAYLHSTKTVHRDIKGANLLVDASGVVKLADFGMAKHLTGQAAELSMKGSPYWMAPEIIHAVNSKDNNGEFPFAVDIWSLGCTIIEIVNGKPPWSEYEGAAAMFKVWKETPPIPETLSPSGKDFLRCCFRRNPGERPTASMLLEHQFLKNSHQPEFQAFTESFSAMKLGDTQLSPRDLTTKKADSMPGSPRTHTTKGKHMLLKLAMY